MKDNNKSYKISIIKSDLNSENIDNKNNEKKVNKIEDQKNVVEDEFMKNYYLQNELKNNRNQLLFENSNSNCNNPINSKSKSKNHSESEFYFEEYDLKHNKDDVSLQNEQEKNSGLGFNDSSVNEVAHTIDQNIVEAETVTVKSNSKKYFKSKTEIKKKNENNNENENLRNTLCLDLLNSNSFHNYNNNDESETIERFDLSIGTIKKKENNFLFSDSQNSIVSKKLKNDKDIKKRKKNIMDNNLLSSLIDKKKDFKDNKENEVIKPKFSISNELKQSSSYSDISNSSSLYEETCSNNSSLNRKSLSANKIDQNITEINKNIIVLNEIDQCIASRKNTTKTNKKKRKMSDNNLRFNKKRINKSLKMLLDNISLKNPIKLNNEKETQNEIQTFKNLKNYNQQDKVEKDTNINVKISNIKNPNIEKSKESRKKIQFKELSNSNKGENNLIIPEYTKSNDNKSEYFDQDVFKEKVSINMDFINDQIYEGKKMFNKAIKKINNGMGNFEVDNYFDENTKFNNELNEHLIQKPHPLSAKYHKPNGKFIEIIKNRPSTKMKDNNCNSNIKDSNYNSSKNFQIKNDIIQNQTNNSQGNNNININNNDLELSNNSESSIFINQCNLHRKMMNESTNAREILIIKDKLNNLKKNYYNQKILKKSYILKVILGFLIFISFVLILFRLYSRNYDDIIKYQNKYKVNENNKNNSDFLSKNNTTPNEDKLDEYKKDNASVLMQNESITNIPIILSNFLFFVDFLNAIININGLYALESLKISRINLCQKSLLFLFCLDISVVLIMIFVNSNSVLILIAIYFCFSSLLGYLFIKTNDVLSLVKKRIAISSS